MLRLEPTWMHVGEAAGHAAALALKSDSPPAAVAVPRLQQRLAERDVMLTFDNGFDAAETAPWADAVQYLGARGFFPDYDADPDAPLTEPVADQWIAATAAWLTGEEDPSEHGRPAGPKAARRSPYRRSWTASPTPATANYQLPTTSVSNPTSSSRAERPVGFVITYLPVRNSAYSERATPK
jgi:hypothetical protein